MRGYQTRRNLFVESLESRRLLTANQGGGHMPILDAGVLTISGTGKNDQIVVSVADTLLTVSLISKRFSTTPPM